MELCWDLCLEVRLIGDIQPGCAQEVGAKKVGSWLQRSCCHATLELGKPMDSK